MLLRQPATLDSSDLVLVGRVSAALSEVRPSAGSLSATLDLLRRHLGAGASELFLLDPLGGELFLSALSAGNDEAAFCSRERFELEQGYPGIVGGLRPHLTTTNLSADVRFLRQQVPSLGYGAFASVRVCRGPRLLGTLNAAWKTAPTDLDRAVQVMSAVGAPLGMAVVAGFADRSPPQGRRAATTSTLTELARSFRSAGAGDAATLMVLGQDGRPQHLGSTGDVDVCCDQLRLTGHCGRPGALSQGRCVVLRGDREAWPAQCQTLTRAHKSFVAVPLSTDVGLVGFAYVGYDVDHGKPSTRHLASLAALGKDVAPLVEQLAETPPRREVRPLDAAPQIDEQPAKHPRLRITCLGPLEVRVDGELVPLRSFSRVKAVELLRVLAMHPGRVFNAEALVERLWPDAEASLSRLHVTLHALRRAIEPADCGRNWLHIKSVGAGFMLDAADCWVDLEEFRGLLGHAASAGDRRFDDVPGAVRLERAIRLYRGDLFSEDVHSSWVVAGRELFRGLYLGALVARATQCLGAQEVEAGLTLLKLAVATEPTREDIHQLLISTLWTTGRRAEARRQYESCVGQLRDELGVEPLPETVRLGQQVGALG